MTKLVVLFLASLVGLASGTSAQMIDIPWPIISGNSSRVMIMKVQEISKPFEANVKQHGSDRFLPMTLATCTAEPIENLRDKNGKGKWTVMKFVMPVRPPQPVGAGGMGVAVGDGPSYPNLQVGEKYAFFLEDAQIREGKEGKEQTENFLPGYFKNFRPVDDPQIKEIRAVANVNAWEWGKPVDGLQVAITISRSSPTPNGEVFLSAAIAVRNAGRQPLVIDLNSSKQPVAVWAQASKQRVDAKFNGGPPPKMPAHTLQRGEILWIGPNGLAPYGLGFQMPLSHGSFEEYVPNLYASFEHDAADSSPESKDAWTGKISSEGTPLTLPNKRLEQK